MKSKRSISHKMLVNDAAAEGSLLTDCMDEMQNFILTLDRFPPRLVAEVLRIHLGIVLCALLECELCTPVEIVTFARTLEKESLDRM